MKLKLKFLSASTKKSTQMDSSEKSNLDVSNFLTFIFFIYYKHHLFCFFTIILGDLEDVGGTINPRATFRMPFPFLFGPSTVFWDLNTLILLVFKINPYQFLVLQNIQPLWAYRLWKGLKIKGGKMIKIVNKPMKRHTQFIFWK